MRRLHPPSLSFLLRPFHVGPATWGRPELRRASARSPGWAPALEGPHHARAADLPATRPRGSNFLLGPAKATDAVPARRGQAPAGHRGHLRSQIPDPGDGAGQAALAAGALGDWLVCWNLPRCVSLREAKCFCTFKKNVFLLSGCRWGCFESLPLFKAPASLRPEGRLCAALSRSRVHKCLGALRLEFGLFKDRGAQRPLQTGHHLGWIPWP